jgi:TetR/AcrR family transcriptional regulator
MEDKKDKRSPGRPSKKQGTNVEELLWVAVKAFAKKGFGGVSLNYLAQEAGVADSLLHYHFDNKKELWKKALSFVGSKIQEELDKTAPLIADLDGLQQMKVLNRQIVYISARYPEFQQIVVQEVFSKSERSKWLIEELLTPIYSHHERLRIQEQAKGTIKDVPPANLVSFMFGAITTFFARSYQMETQFGVDSFDKDEVEQHAQIINDLIFNGLLNK